ncbi:MAG: hypothetical protein GKR88_08810 [Flavobacteriaceae bacterium]|nr:MAG: hypothetical protein GKR88_08810 [Flavobacteriaceae bacterium]
MKTFVKILFVIFVVWMLVGACFLYVEHEKAQVVMGLGVFFFSFIFMPFFIYHRYRAGKYKKYIIDGKTFFGKMNQDSK